MNVKKIVVASTLKPINDTRMYEKIGISLGKDKSYEVHLVGYQSNIPDNSSLIFHPLFAFKRISLKRLLAPLKFLLLLLHIKPQLIIVCTYELLSVAVLYKALCKCKVIYDVQENYCSNIITTTTYPLLVRIPLALYVRAKELPSSPFIDYYLLAEKIYAKELGFTKGKSMVLENKYKGEVFTRAKKENDSPTRLLYTGTIAEEYGVFEAIELAKNLHELEPNITLTIIGYASKETTLTQLKKAIAGCYFISLKGGDRLIPHAEILEEIKLADFGLVCYRPNKNTENRIPTKLYEYLALQLPIIVQNNKLWVELCSAYQSARVIDFQNYDVISVLNQIKTSKSYPNGTDRSLLWESEEEKLIALIKGII